MKRKERTSPLERVCAALDTVRAREFREAMEKDEGRLEALRRLWRRTVLSAHPDRQGGSKERWAEATELLEALQELEGSLIHVNVRTDSGKDAKKQKAAFKRWMDHPAEEVHDLGPYVSGEEAPPESTSLGIHVDDYVELTEEPVTRLVTSDQILTCSPCAGTGREKWVEGMDVPVCEVCEGVGGQYLRGNKTGAHNSWEATITACQMCDGRGHRSTAPAGRCARCEGTGLYKSGTNLRVWSVQLARGARPDQALPQETPGPETYLSIDAAEPYSVQAKTQARYQAAYWRRLYQRLSAKKRDDGVLELTFFLSAVRQEIPLFRVPGKSPSTRWLRGQPPHDIENCRESAYRTTVQTAGGDVQLTYRVKWVNTSTDMSGMPSVFKLLRNNDEMLGCEGVLPAQPVAQPVAQPPQTEEAEEAEDSKTSEK